MDIDRRSFLKVLVGEWQEQPWETPCSQEDSKQQKLFPPSNFLGSWSTRPDV